MRKERAKLEAKRKQEAEEREWKERLENETDIFGQRQPDLSTFIQLEIKEYHDTHDSARNRRIRVAGNKLNLDHFVHRHHENPQTSLSTSSTSSTSSSNPQHDYDNGNNDEIGRAHV